MFFLLRLAIWIAGVACIAYFVLSFLGYGINWNYWDEQKVDCQARLDQCKVDLVKTGIEGAKKTCDFNCVDPKLLIRKNPE